MNEIKYLIKFVEKEEYAKMLVSGKMYLNTIAYFHKCYYQEYYKQYKIYNEQKIRNFEETYKGAIGDIREALIFGCAHLPTNIPVYCFQQIYKKQCEEIDGIECIHIQEKVVEEFRKTGKKYFVVINFKEIKDILDRICCGYGSVHYINKAKTLDMDIFNSKRELIYYCKQPHFSYQQEFRVIFNPILPDKYEFKQYDLVRYKKFCRLNPRGHQQKYEGHLFDLKIVFGTATYQPIKCIKDNKIILGKNEPTFQFI